MLVGGFNVMIGGVMSWQIVLELDVQATVNVYPLKQLEQFKHFVDPKLLAYVWEPQE